MEKRWDTIKFERPVDEPSSVDLNFLKPAKKVFWGARTKSFAVV